MMISWVWESSCWMINRRAVDILDFRATIAVVEAPKSDIQTNPIRT